MWVKFKLSFQTDTNGNKVFVFPDDRNLFTGLIDLDGEYFAAKYSGNKDLPIYISPAPKTRRIISTLEFYKRVPTRLMIALVNPDIVVDIETHTMLKVFNNYIQCSQVAGENGLSFGVDLNDEMVKEGFNEALRGGMITQAEIDAVLK